MNGADHMNALIRGRVGIDATEAEAQSEVTPESSVGFDGGARKAAARQFSASEWFNALVDEELHGGSAARGRR